MKPKLQQAWAALKRRPRRWSAVSLAVVLGLLFTVRSVYILQQTELAWVSGGYGAGRCATRAGLHAKWPWESVRRFGARLITQEFPIVEQLTRDGEPIHGQAALTWRPSPAGLGQRIALPDTDGELGLRLATWVGTELDAELSRCTLSDLVSTSAVASTMTGMELTATRVLARSRVALLRRFGVELTDVRIVRLSIPEASQARFFRAETVAHRLSADRIRQAAGIEAATIRERAAVDAGRLRADTVEKVASIRAEAQAEQARVMAQVETANPGLAALGRTLDEYRLTADAGTIVVVEGGAEFFRLLERQPAETATRPAGPASRPSS